MQRIWNNFLRPIWSFIINFLYWIIRPHRVCTTIKRRNLIAKSIHSLSDIKTLMSKCRYKKDKTKDWLPWIITLVDRDFEDDCDGAAILGRWAFKQIGVKSDLVSLYGKNSGHMICVSKDRKYIISNNYIFNLITNNWKKETLDIFKGKYNKILM